MADWLPLALTALAASALLNVWLSWRLLVLDSEMTLIRDDLHMTIAALDDANG